jgi:hypothetical protein
VCFQNWRLPSFPYYLSFLFLLLMKWQSIVGQVTQVAFKWTSYSWLSFDCIIICVAQAFTQRSFAPNSIGICSPHWENIYQSNFEMR